MNIETTFKSGPRIARRSPGADGETIIAIAILAVGGQGGGVLTNWITAVAEANGYRAQSTSVAGVAQRTGATIYYIEMCRDTGRQPVFSLSPSEGDVDILIASELMETGRAIMRNFVTPGRTTIVASTHRIPAISEKIVPGDGIVDGSDVIKAMGLLAEKVVAFDMEALAKQAGSVISSSLLGGLAGSGALPFSRESFEEVIAKSGRGVSASLRAFGHAYDCARGIAEPPHPQAPVASVPVLEVPRKLAKEWAKLEDRRAALPQDAQEMVGLGLKKVVDYQDLAYGSQYLTMVEAIAKHDSAPFAMTQAAAKYVARALCYDDLLRVADLKTRATRLRRVRDEVVVNEGQVLLLTEYFHPRYEELITTMPRPIGQWLARRQGIAGWYGRNFDKGRRLRTDSLRGFLALWLVSSLRPYRRKLLRHTREMAHVTDWFDTVQRLAPSNPAMAIEILSNYRLIKGYSDTHSRGMSKFARVTSALPLLENREDGADWMRRLRTAALADADGIALDGALATVKSFAGTGD